MGSRQSTWETRSVSMDNPTPPSVGVIDVSDEVVQRLKLGIKKAPNSSEANKENEVISAVPGIKQSTTVGTQTKLTVPSPAVRPIYVAPSPSASPPPPPPPPPPQSKSTAASSSSSPLSQSPTSGIGISVPNLSVMEERRQKEIELQQNDQMWRNRMAKLEQTLNKTNAIMEKEYSMAMDDVRKRFASPTIGHKMPMCQDFKTKLIACYRANPGQTLNCANEVAQFRNCISLTRVQKLDALDEVATAAGDSKSKSLSPAAAVADSAPPKAG